MKLTEVYTLVSKKNKDELCEIIKVLLRVHASPVFGAAKQIEYEIAAIKALKMLGYLKNDADEYDYIDKLKITKSKARSLMYQEALRSNTDFDAELKKILKKPTIQKDGKGMFLIEISNPLVMDKLRKKVRDLGFITDESFSGSIAKLSLEALSKLIETLIDENNKMQVLQELKNQGYPDVTIGGFIKEALKKIGSKVADSVGEQIMDNVGEFCEKIFDNLPFPLTSLNIDSNTILQESKK